MGCHQHPGIDHRHNDRDLESGVDDKFERQDKPSCRSPLCHLL
ncbi:MAG: hypothetical protein ACFFBP_07775 [Promethearchaeota archaeon]